MNVLIFLLRAYKLTISPYLGQNCRFHPSCSVYAELAIRRYGVIKGTALAGKRLCKCHPWHVGGIDLVPERETRVDSQPGNGDSTSSTSSRLKLARFCSNLFQGGE